MAQFVEIKPGHVEFQMMIITFNIPLINHILGMSSSQLTNSYSQPDVSQVIFIFGYGSIPINTIFRGMNIHKSQLF
jgi:hypothetical protein